VSGAVGEEKWEDWERGSQTREVGLEKWEGRSGSGNV